MGRWNWHGNGVCARVWEQAGMVRDREATGEGAVQTEGQAPSGVALGDGRDLRDRGG